MSRRRGRRDPYRCPSCGERAEEPQRTWTLVSPIPDKKGRITVTIMAAFRCPACGASWNAPIEKIKTGGDEGGEEREERRPGQVIEIDLSELRELEE